MEIYYEPLKETVDIFKTVISNADLERYISIKVLGNDKIKTVTKLYKPSELVKYETKIDLYIIVNESIFDQLEENQKMFIAEETIAGVYFNDERGKLVINGGDVTTYSGILKKYGYDMYENVYESIKTLFSIKENGGDV